MRFFFPSPPEIATSSRRLPTRSSGFTLVELLVVVFIVGMLGALTMGMVNRVKKSAQTARELGGARTLGAALALHSADNNGVLPRGFDDTAQSVSIDGSGFAASVVSSATAHRYPWRLASYFGFKFDTATVLDSRLKPLLDKQDTYMLSVIPSLGMNVYGVGGYYLTGEAPSEGAVYTMAAAHSPSSLIAFASTHSSDARLDGGTSPGFHMVTPRLMPKGSWAGEYDPATPSSWGNLDLRHNNKAVVCFLDGSAALLDKDQLKDMRHWSNQAAIDNNPEYRFTKTSGGRR